MGDLLEGPSAALLVVILVGEFFKLGLSLRVCSTAPLSRDWVLAEPRLVQATFEPLAEPVGDGHALWEAVRHAGRSGVWITAPDLAVGKIDLARYTASPV